MSHAVTALLLLQLDRTPGQWVRVQDMAMHLSLARPVVCDHLLPLAVTGQVWLQRDATGLLMAAMSPLGDLAPADPDAGLGGPDAAEATGRRPAIRPLPHGQTNWNDLEGHPGPMRGGSDPQQPSQPTHPLAEGATA